MSIIETIVNYFPIIVGKIFSSIIYYKCVTQLKVWRNCHLLRRSVFPFQRQISPQIHLNRLAFLKDVGSIVERI